MYLIRLLVMVIILSSCKRHDDYCREQEFADQWWRINGSSHMTPSNDLLKWEKVGESWLMFNDDSEEKRTGAFWYKNNFIIEYQDDAQYLITIDKAPGKLQLWCNGIQVELLISSDGIQYANVSEHVYQDKIANELLIVSEDTQLNPWDQIELLKLPSLHIPMEGVSYVVKSHGNNKLLQLKVNVKNTSAFEQQCLLKTQLTYKSKHFVKETPLFLPAKSENEYEHLFLMSALGQLSDKEQVFIIVNILKSDRLIDQVHQNITGN